jgi:ATP-binding cassette subfamily C (CFTR/MRP) protein 4
MGNPSRLGVNSGSIITTSDFTARSPVFSHLSTSLYGLATIRAFKAEDEFIKQFDDHQDLHSSTWYGVHVNSPTLFNVTLPMYSNNIVRNASGFRFLFICSTRWFGIWLDWISVFFIAAVTFSFMFGSNGKIKNIMISIMVVQFQWSSILR